MTESRILVLDDSADVGVAAEVLLRRRFGIVKCIQRPTKLIAALEEHRPAVLLLDLNFTPGAYDGAEGMRILQILAARKDAPAVIVMTAYGEIELAVAALKLGAFDFVVKPWNNQKLIATVSAAIGSRVTHVAGSNDTLQGDSKPMQELRALIASVAPTEASVLILGESGSGKELVAREIHALSRRNVGPFLAVDVGALQNSMFESELFGHRKGSFTDAHADRDGRFQAARGGTLFLDEIGNLPLTNQAKLLAVLERREVTPLGADKPLPVDVRVICATNLEEKTLFDPNTFRTDLLHRLNTIVIRVPPLRARRSDILNLAQTFLLYFARQHGLNSRILGEEAARALQERHWLGNVRELRHACERAVILAQGHVLSPQDFIADFATADDSQGDDGQWLRLDKREKDAVSIAMQQSKGNISQAAKLLGVSRAALYRKLNKHEI